MADFNVAEKFISINGEGTHAGQLAVFVRFTGCNLNCSYCDTKWANQNNTPYETMTANQIYDYIKQSGITNVTITGGEPLMQKNIYSLLETLSADKSLYVEIETNGSIPIETFARLKNPPVFTMDYKLPFSQMENFMNKDNFNYLTKNDTIKFVIADENDMNTALKIINQYSLTEICNVYFSPVFSCINPADIVEFMKEHKLNNVNFQLQMHKYIWSPDAKGV
ncbi:MAG: putative 7-carboxy-7-deazaguanine synthase QueE [Oscillospiraceae bacterium]